MATTDIDDLPKLKYQGQFLLPLQDGYDLSGPYGALVTDAPGGMPAVRRNTVNNAQIVTASYSLNNPVMIQWFQMWYKLSTLEGSMPFITMLSLGEPEPEMYVVIPMGAPKYNDFKGFDTTVSFQFAARKIVDDYEYWDVILAISEELDPATYLNAIDQFANFDITASLRRC